MTQAANNVLFIGPDYHNHRGGIGAVLEVYGKNIYPFKFIPTYSNRSAWHKFYFFLRAIFLLCYKFATDREIQIVHIHSSSRGSFLRKSVLMLLCKLFRKKTIFHIHASEFHIFYQNARMLRGYVRWILQRTDTVVCLSGRWKKFFTENFKIKELVIINNVIEYVTQKKEPIQNTRKINLLFLGQIGNRKGIFDLIEVLHKNRKNFNGKYHLIVGGNGEVGRLQKLIHEYNLEDHIEYAGWVNGNKKSELLQKCDVYVLPSYNEGLPVSVLEALAHGKPVISTKVGGIPEVIHSHYNGWLMKAGDRLALEAILTEVFANKPLLRRYGINSLKISRNYTPGVVLESLDVLYRKLAKAS